MGFDMVVIKKHKVKIIAALVIVVALVVAWSYGETPITGGDNTPATLALAETDADANATDQNGISEADELNQSENDATGQDENGELDQNGSDELNENQTDEQNQDTNGELDQNGTDELNENQAQLGDQNQADGATLTQNQTQEGSSNDNDNAANQANQINEDGSFLVTLSVRVDTILPNMHILDSEKHELIPDNGVIFAARQVTAYEGESVFNVLQREMRRNGIHMASRFTPVFNSAYVEAINNIYEFDVGPLSGWMYRVNGEFPNFGSSRYILSPGDVIEWLYTVDLGRDIGGHAANTGQRGE